MSSVSHRSPVQEPAEFLARRPSPEEIMAFRLSEGAIERSRELLDKNAAGTLTDDETHELDRLVVLDDVISLIRSQVITPSNDSGSSATPTR